MLKIIKIGVNYKIQYHDIYQQLQLHILMLSQVSSLPQQVFNNNPLPKEFSQLTCSLFPQIFSLIDCQKNDLAENMFKLALTWFNYPIQKLKFYQSIIKQQDLLQIKEKLSNRKYHEYVFYCEYGCIVDLFREEKISPTELNIIFSKQWDFSSTNTKGTSTNLPYNPKSSTYLSIGSLTFGCYTLQQEKLRFTNIFNQIHIKIQEKIQDSTERQKKLNYHNPTWLLQAAKQIRKRINNGESDQTIINTIKDNAQQFQARSKGGTLDVGKYGGKTKPNTSFELVKAYLYFLIQDKQLIDTMMIDSKLSFITQKIMLLRNVSVYQDKKFRQCLLKLIKQIKELTNNEIIYNEQVFNIKIQRTYKHLNSLLVKKQRQVITIQKLNKTVNQSITLDKDYRHTFNSISSYDFENLQSVKHPGQFGFSKPLRIFNNFTQIFKNKYDQYLWILMVEQIFFDIAITRLGPKNIPIDISLSEIQCNTASDFSIMHKIINKYEQIMKSDKNKKFYGQMLQNQTYSHLYLIKYIGSAIAFQVIKRQRKDKESNLGIYRIPQDIRTLYTMFHSLSSIARQAMQAMIQYYLRNKTKSPIFSLDGTNSSFVKYANIVANQDINIKIWMQNQKQLLVKKISNLSDQFLSFKVKYEGATKEKNKIQNRKCQCQHRWIGRYNGQYVLIKCSRCYDLEEINSKLSSLQSKKEKKIISPYAEKDIHLYGFIRRTPFDILGMMKIIYESQIQKFRSQNSQMNKNFFTQSYEPMTPYTSQVSLQQIPLYLNYLAPPQSFVNYPSKKTRYYYRDILQSVSISKKLLLQDHLLNPEFKKIYQFMIDSPNIANSTRQHQNYSNLYNKGKHENIENFLAFSNVRVGQQTQLMVLGQKIKNRSLHIKDIISDSNIAHHENNKQLGIYAKILVVLKSVADINGFRKFNEETQEYLNLPQINQCVEDLLQNYQKKWSFEDMYFLHTVGAIFSLLSVLIKKPHFAVRLATRAYQQNSKYTKQTGVGDNNIKSQISYFLHGMLSCFTEDVTHKKDRQSVQTFTKIIMLYRINKVFADQNTDDTRFRETISFWEHFRQRAIFNNVDNVKDYFKNNLSQITNMVQIIDKGVPAEIQWTHDTIKGQYVFTGIYQKKQYNLNLFTGILLKNNCQLAGLPSQIKIDKRYIQIFGQDRDLQILPQTDESLRTPADFSDFFPNQPNTKIFFQFKTYQKDIVIRMIIKRNKNNVNKQLKYVLISEGRLDDSNFIVPHIYRKQYFAWYCENKRNQRKCVILAQYYQSLGKKHFYLQMKEEQYKINQKENPYNFQNFHRIVNITFFPKRKEENINYFNEGFLILNSIQFSNYIIQISSTSGQGKQRKIKFWLHRYNLKFSLCPQNGLLSDNYQGYAICQQYNSHQLLPWGIFEKVNCLVLGKIQNHLRFAKNHQKMILIPNTQIILNKANRKINQIIIGQTRTMKMFNYQIHDFYKDIRPKTRLQQLHLACIIASCYVPMFQPLMMTNIEYAIHLMRSCLNPAPFSPQQLGKLQNILKNCIQLNQLSLILISQAIYQAQKSLKQILPYNSGKIYKIQNNRQTRFDKYSQFIINCKDEYCANLERQAVPIRQELGELELKMLNLSKAINIMNKSQKKQSRWKLTNKIDFKLRINIQQSIKDWENQIHSYCQNIKRIIAEQIYIQENSLLSQINIEEQYIHKQENDIPLQINSAQQSWNVLIDSGAWSFIQSNINMNSLQQSAIVQKNQGLNIQQTDAMSKQNSQQLASSVKSYLKLKQKLDKIIISNIKRQKYISEIKDQIIEVKKTRADILQLIEAIQSDNRNHHDFLSGRYTIIKQRDFTEILCNQNYFKRLYPDVKKEKKTIFQQLIKLWIRFSIYQGSLQRILLILQDKQHQQLDKVNLLREIESPRDQIIKINPWICFYLEMKSQIWLSQYETFKLLGQNKQNKSNPVTQLNMGEGKTQIIIPMLVLYEIYINKKLVPRVNILSPLYKEAQINYFKFFSITGFKINIFPIYFNRTVDISETNIRKLQNIMNLFKKRSLILIDRDSSLSMILKLRQQLSKPENTLQIQKIEDKNCNQKDKWMFRNILILDIFDEVDALMTAKKSFVYAFKESSELPNKQIRFQYNRLLIQIIAKQMLDFLLQNQMIVIEQSLQFSKKIIKEGKFPKGLRLLTNINQKKILQFRKILVTNFLNKYLPPQFQFYKQLKQMQRQNLIIYLINSSTNFSDTISCHKNIPDRVYNQIFAVRGIVAYGVLQHCLTLRCGVDYGVPNQKNPKRVGVPYEAADVPSQRSQYSHPEVATILSYFSYFNKGLKQQQFNEALKSLLLLPQSSKKTNYSLWLNCIQSEDKKPKLVRDPRQINQQSATQKKQLYQTFRYCRNTIVFWLVRCVFRTDLKQYKTSMTASSWDLANSVKSLGFSGTKDTHWILPTYLKLLKTQNNQINGTDGKMINLMISHTLDVSQIVQNSEDLWKRFILTALKKQIGCIIDAGAILAGKSLQNNIVPWIGDLQQFKELQYRGISFCDQRGNWKVYDTSSHTTIDRQTSISEHQTFVIFDEARTRGADIKMKNNTKAVLSLGPNMTKDKLMQAVGRLRKFGRNQQIYILSTKQNYSKIKGFNIINSIKNKTQSIIEWACINSMNDNKKMLYPNSKLAWIHFKNVGQHVDTLPQGYNPQSSDMYQEFNPQLSEMYQQPIKYQEVSFLNQQMANSFLILYKQNKFATDLVNSIKSYGQNVRVRCQNLQDICERQTQLIQQAVQIEKNEFAELKPMEESKSLQKYLDDLSTMDFELNDRLFFSKNFKECTYFGTQKKIQDNNELCQINFALIKPNANQFMIITQRQANLKILKGTQCLGPYSCIRETRQKQFIVRFNDLKIDLLCIKQNEFEQALTDAQFFNGNENFEDIQLLHNTIKNNLSIISDQITLQDLICHFLIRRRTKQNKFSSSDLEKILIKMNNTK